MNNVVEIKKYKRRLKTSTDCRRFLASLVNDLMEGTIDPGIAGRAAYITNILVRCIQGDSNEERLQRLEKLFDRKPGHLQAIGGGR